LLAEQWFSVQVQSSSDVMQQLLGSGAPGVAALMLHRLQQQADKCWANTSGENKHQAGQLKS